MTDVAQKFEDYYQRWKAFAQSEAVSLSSADEDYLKDPNFDAIVELGYAAVPYIIDKLETDEIAHFLIHALERITHKQFSPTEIEAAEASYGSPLGNQGYAALWRDWWQRQDKK